MTSKPAAQTVESAVSRLRAASPADAAELLRLIEICDTAEIGAPDYSLEDVEDDLGRPSWTGWVLEGDDGFVAYCWTDWQAGKPWVNAEVRVRPGEPAVIGDELLDVVRRHAATIDRSLPMRVFSVAGATAARSRLDAAGGRVIRHYWRMVLEIPDGEVPEPVLPAGVTVEQPDDARDELQVVHRVIDTAFLDHFGSSATEFDEWLERQRTSPGADLGLWWLARVDGEPAAVLIGRMWPECGWVQGLGTLREFRGRGLGHALLRTSFTEFNRRGYRSVALSVDAANPTGAVALYESVGMRRSYEAVLYELPPVSG
jgi:mycothiol synthase